jgi:lysyl-tRNA synthetase class 2
LAILEQERLADRKRCLLLRARVIQSVRQFFIENGYLEVETPILIPAPAPEPHIDALRVSPDQFLQTSPELCMKRLLAADYSKIFQICRCFRGEERGDLHLPEFTLLEWYRAGADYKDLMGDCEEMVLYAARALGFEDKIVYRNKVISLERPWDRITVKEAFERFASISMERALALNRFDEILIEEIESGLNKENPVFLYDYPIPQASLARIKDDDSEIAERFELYIGGLELANAFSELIDVHEQRERFDRDNNIRKQMGKIAYPISESFLNALKKMPASAGIAFGLDRLVMLFADAVRIDDVVSFTPEEL